MVNSKFEFTQRKILISFPKSCNSDFNIIKCFVKSKDKTKSLSK